MYIEYYSHTNKLKILVCNTSDMSQTIDYKVIGLAVWCLTQISTIFQLYSHGWFATSHARILEHCERRLEVGLCSCTI